MPKNIYQLLFYPFCIWFQYILRRMDIHTKIH